jgi:rod shape determining protein RodA
MELRRYFRLVDWTLVVTTVVLIGIGLVFIASATSAQPVGGDSLFYFKRQLAWAVISLAAMIVTIVIDYNFILRMGHWIYLANLGVLIVVLVAGTTVFGAQRWLQVGPVQVQPSEFAKVAMIVGLASFIARRAGNAAQQAAGTSGASSGQSWVRRTVDLLPSFAYVGLPTYLVFRQPDLGTSLVFVAIFLGMVYVAGADPKVLFGLSGGAVGAGSLAIWLHYRFGLPIPLKEYQLRRIMTFIQPGQDLRAGGYHTHQSQIAIGSGRWLGKGLWAGSQNQLNFLPMRHTDFIFSVIGEEAGFIGAVVVVGLFLVLVWRCVLVAGHAKDLEGALLAVGAASLIGFHVLVNIGMATGIMPVTGLPLPFITAGGSSLLANCVAVGLVINVSIRRYKIYF